MQGPCALQGGRSLMDDITLPMTGTGASEGGQPPALCESFIAGILHHLQALALWTLPSPLSVHRVQPSSWTGAFRCLMVVLLVSASQFLALAGTGASRGAECVHCAAVIMLPVSAAVHMWPSQTGKAAAKLSQSSPLLMHDVAP